MIVLVTVINLISCDFQIEYQMFDSLSNPKFLQINFVVLFD